MRTLLVECQHQPTSIRQSIQRRGKYWLPRMQRQMQIRVMQPRMQPRPRPGARAVLPVVLPLLQTGPVLAPWSVSVYGDAIFQGGGNYDANEAAFTIIQYQGNGALLVRGRGDNVFQTQVTTGTGDGQCVIDYKGDLACTGTKSAAVKVASG